MTKSWLDQLSDAPERGPVQVDSLFLGGVGGHNRRSPTLPMGVLELAYEDYAFRNGTSQSLARLNERGGLSLG